MSSTPTLNIYRPNLTSVQVGSVTYWFSYQTCVAYGYGGTLVVSENVWSQTTGKHLNEIDGGSKEAKARRLPFAEFEARLVSLTEEA